MWGVDDNGGGDGLFEWAGLVVEFGYFLVETLVDSLQLINVCLEVGVVLEGFAEVWLKWGQGALEGWELGGLVGAGQGFSSNNFISQLPIFTFKFVDMGLELVDVGF